MLDRIITNSSDSVRRVLEAEGFTDVGIIHTNKRTNIALFANIEVVHYLVVEDSFSDGRPALEKAGVILTDRVMVDKADVMKVTTCLNPLYTAMSIVDEMKYQDIVGLIEKIDYQERLPIVESIIANSIVFDFNFY